MIARQKPVKLLARLTALALTACLLVSGLGVGALAVDASSGKLENNQQKSYIRTVNCIFPLNWSRTRHTQTG